ncbi:MAG: hypothetical protein ACLUOI_40255 [Eisenbergiella sp.]
MTLVWRRSTSGRGSCDRLWLVNGRGVFAFAHDFAVLGGAMEMQGMKSKKNAGLALDAGLPLSD